MLYMLLSDRPFHCHSKGTHLGHSISLTPQGVSFHFYVLFLSIVNFWEEFQTKKKKSPFEQAVVKLSLRQLKFCIRFIYFPGKMFLRGFVFCYMHFFRIISGC